MPESRTLWIRVALVAWCCMPLLSQAQDPRRTIFIKEPTGWFGVRITDQVMMDAQGNAFFDSYPVVEDVTPNSPAARAAAG